MNKDRICEAPYHVKGCNGIGETYDHFTPRCIGKFFGWTDAQIEGSENQQWLSLLCHTEKDRTTEARLKALISQRLGAGISLSTVRKWASLSIYNLEGPQKKWGRR